MSHDLAFLRCRFGEWRAGNEEDDLRELEEYASLLQQDRERFKQDMQSKQHMEQEQTGDPIGVDLWGRCVCDCSLKRGYLTQFPCV